VCGEQRLEDSGLILTVKSKLPPSPALTCPAIWRSRGAGRDAGRRAVLLAAALPFGRGSSQGIAPVSSGLRGLSSGPASDLLFMLQLPSRLRKHQQWFIIPFGTLFYCKASGIAVIDSFFPSVCHVRAACSISCWFPGWSRQEEHLVWKMGHCVHFL